MIDDERNARDDEDRAREPERVARLESAFVQLNELAVSANKRMNGRATRLMSVEEAVLMLARLARGKDDKG